MTRFLTYASLAATVFFVLALLSLHFLSSEYDPMEYGISFYALTQYGYLIGLALIIIGVSGIALAGAMWSKTKSIAGRVGLLLMIAWGLLSVLAGIFPLDVPGTHATQSGTIHNLVGMNFLLITPALLLIELSQPIDTDDGRNRTITFWLAWLLLLSSVLLFTFNGPLSSIGIGGLFQRLYWLVLVTWLFIKAVPLIRDEKVPQGTNLLKDSV
jgi:hypothetical membrane protein